MNKVILMGRLTRDPDCGAEYARYTLAVDRYGEGADFINCVTFKKGAEFAEKFLRKGVKIAVEGHIQTGSYTNKDGVKINTTDVVVERHEFCEKKAATEPAQDATRPDEYISIPKGLDDELPFH